MIRNFSIKAIALFLVLRGPSVVNAEDGEPNRPLLPTEITQLLRDRPALSAIPDDSIVELCRVHQKDAEVRYDDETGALIVEAKLVLDERMDPPDVTVEKLDSSYLRDKTFLNEYAKESLDGLTPDHLAFAADPEFIKTFVKNRIGDDEDIAESVFSHDSRYVYRDTRYPWSTVGKVQTAEGSCTGTMIGPRLMLTASHCVNWLDGGSSAGWIKFTPAYYNGDSPFGLAWGTHIYSWMVVEGPGLSNQETAFDHVVVVLDRYMGYMTGFAGYRTYNSAWNGGNYWQNMGYPGPLTGGERPVFSGSGEMRSVQSYNTAGQTGYVIGHYIDTERGHSGGPFWGWWSGENYPRVIGDQSSAPSNPGPTTSGDNEASGGPALSALITWCRTNFP